VGSFRGHQNGANALVFTHDGTRLATAAGGLRIWDLASGQEVLQLSPESAFLGLAFDGQGRRLATAGGDGTVRLWDAERLPEPPEPGWEEWLLERREPIEFFAPWVIGGAAVLVSGAVLLALVRWLRRRRAAG
jgi:hypothetical protein